MFNSAISGVLVPQFTGKERDAETGLDFFLARYYSRVEGRFMAPDWSSSPAPVPYAKLDNPQTLNLHVYVQNNSAEQKRMHKVESLFQQLAFNPPEKTEIMSLCGLSAKNSEATLRLLVEHKRLARVDRDLCFHLDALAKAMQLAVDYLKKENRLESMQWKYLLDASRKYALPLLDYLDKIGITKRGPDNTGYLGPKAQCSGFPRLTSQGLSRRPGCNRSAEKGLPLYCPAECALA
jgi:RHS repeat-associated protein